MNSIQILLIQIAVILLLSRLLGVLMRAISQPQVVGEMIAGIMLGPSLLGLFHHGTSMHRLFPQSSLGNLGALSQLGVMMFMFLVGLELDPKLLRGQGKSAMTMSLTGIVLPFACGAALAYGLIHLQPAVTGPVISTLVLCLFMGAAMSITAFPVLARILTERNLQRTKTGVLALTCAAMDDVMGWCVLALVIAIAQLKGFGAGSPGHSGALRSALITVVSASMYVFIMIVVVRKLLARLQHHFETRGYLSQNVLAAVFLLLIASSVTTDLIGIHQIFGAFMFGAVMPKEGHFVKHLSEKVEDFTILFLLPLFFAYTGLQTELGLLRSPMLWAICGLIIFAAAAGKFGGVSIAARFCGMSWRQSGLLGVLMNTRGLMELIILEIGLSFGVLSKPLFAMMVVMALVTTFMTTPLMRLLYSPARQKKELEDAAREDAEKVPGVHVVVPVSLKSTAPALVRIGAMLMGTDPGRLYAVHLDRPEEYERRSKSAMIDADRVLQVAQRTAQAARVPVNTVSYVSRNIARDISDAVKRFHASWVVLGWRKPVRFKAVLSGTVGQVLRQAPANVAILIDKGLEEVQNIVVPYLGETQDRGALLAAERFGRLPGVKVTILHVVKPNRDNTDERLSVQTSVDKELPGSGAQNAVRMQVVESDSPVKVVVEESRKYDLMVIGVAEEWNLEAVSIFRKHESVAQLSHCSLLIVHANPLAPVVQSEPIAKKPVEAEGEVVGA
ncbi:MAG TPA: cation:proton antiporter [Tepidisphaeraceae bacterium]|nr:cation:proton antiporter [Tepidisphaeraceae bacterium]